MLLKWLLSLEFVYIIEHESSTSHMHANLSFFKEFLPEIILAKCIKIYTIIYMYMWVEVCFSTKRYMSHLTVDKEAEWPNVEITLELEKIQIVTYELL